MASIDHYAKETDVIGAPFAFGQPKPGVANGPKRMREAGIITQLINHGYKVNDEGDIPFDLISDDPGPASASHMKRTRTVGAGSRKIADAVEKSLRAGKQCVTLGGDHSIAIGTIAGQARVHSDFGVIWVDAHADINPPNMSPSGNIHGIPIAFLAHELRDMVPSDLPPEFSWLQPCIHLKDIAYIALRSIDEAEKKILDDYKMTAFKMDDIKQLGIEEVVRRAIEHVSPSGSRPIHLSFDVDGVDPDYTPSTGTPVPGGLDLNEAIYVVQQVAKTGLLAVMDVAEVNPELGSPEDQSKTLDSANKIVAGWFANCRRSPGS